MLRKANIFGIEKKEVKKGVYRFAIRKFFFFHYIDDESDGFMVLAIDSDQSEYKVCEAFNAINCCELREW